MNFEATVSEYTAGMISLIKQDDRVTLEGSLRPWHFQQNWQLVTCIWQLSEGFMLQAA
jgi:hypothetical protein